MYIELREFQVEDARGLYEIAVDPRVRDRPIEENMRIAERNVKNGPAFTALYEGKVIGVFGMWISRNRGLVWAIFSPAITGCTFAISKAIRTILAVLIEQHDIKRVWSVAVKSCPATRRLLEHLGFTLNKSHDDEELFLMRI